MRISKYKNRKLNYFLPIALFLSWIRLYSSKYNGLIEQRPLKRAKIIANHPYFHYV